jgi:hypothetical protein
MVCWDHEPDRLVVSDARRDALDDTDSFQMIFDAFRDEQNGWSKLEQQWSLLRLASAGTLEGVEPGRDPHRAARRRRSRARRRPQPHLRARRQARRRRVPRLLEPALFLAAQGEQRVLRGPRRDRRVRQRTAVRARGPQPIVEYSYLFDVFR